MALLINISGSYLKGERYLVQVYWVVVEFLHCLQKRKLKEKKNY